MGIYDREYYRREGPSFLDALTGRGQACKWLIMLNVGIFIIQVLTRPRGQLVGPFDEAFWLDVPDVMHGQVWRLVSYAFLHANIMHLLFNMLFLWWFGSDVEDVYGTREFTALYLTCALFGGLFQVSLRLLGLVPESVCLGASGAVTGILVVCASHFPTRVIYLFFVLPIPIWLFVIFNVAQDLLGVLGGSPGETAFSVHLGGAAFGFLYYNRQWRLLSLLPDFRSWQRPQRRPDLRIYREEAPQPAVSVAATTSAPETDEHLEAKVDALLEKVGRSGQASLTASEREFLQRASEVYKKRRN